VGRIVEVCCHFAPLLQRQDEMLTVLRNSGWTTAVEGRSVCSSTCRSHAFVDQFARWNSGTFTSNALRVVESRVIDRVGLIAT
jgi:hypothetical protein